MPYGFQRLHEALFYLDLRRANSILCTNCQGVPPILNTCFAKHFGQALKFGGIILAIFLLLNENRGVLEKNHTSNHSLLMRTKQTATALRP